MQGTSPAATYQGFSNVVFASVLPDAKRQAARSRKRRSKNPGHLCYNIPGYHQQGATVIERHHENTCYLQFNHYQQFPEVIHGIFTRKGGYSTGPYEGLNSLGALKSGENIDNVIRNRQLAMQSLGIL